MKFFPIACASLILSTACSPLIAQEGNVKQEVRKVLTTRTQASSTQGIKGFCTQIDRVLISIGINEQTFLSTKGEKRNEKDGNQADIQEIRKKIEEHRTLVTKKRELYFEELTKRATSSVQKEALISFKESTQSALNEKYATIDVLFVAHQEDISKAKELRKSIRAESFATLQENIQKAQEKAKLDCKNGTEGEIVKASLKDAIKKSRDIFTQTVQKKKESRDILEVSLQEKKRKIQEAELEFRKKVEASKNTLKESLNPKPLI